MGVNEQIIQVAKRIFYLRETLDMLPEQVAKAIDMSTEEYNQYENGEKDIPVSMIYSVAAVLGVDATELLTGEAPRMTEYSVTRKGQGAGVERYKGYAFESLAYNYIGRDKEPMIVTISPGDEHPKLITHHGQEFNYVLEGKIGILINNKVIELNEGDSIYFNPNIPHGQIALDGIARFITVIDK
ncbi:MAG: XRE family transcriptional regulator [Clostridiales bacterium GWF2_36_10]|nr:MAG: XRE family transcriptional regulator [Clostridiales bacterium GWF2_36_10]HAN21950.1 XRE family transcriptional regulator [Clostridiales bacterium]